MNTEIKSSLIVHVFIVALRVSAHEEWEIFSGPNDSDPAHYTD